MKPDAENNSTQPLAQKISDEKYSRTREYERSYKRFLIDLVPEGPGKKLLDVGCGTGLNSEQLAVKGYEITGIDISPVAVEQYCGLGFKGEVNDISGGLIFEDNVFDVVFASDVIEHLADQDYFMTEIHRVLKPGGLLFVSTANSAFWVYRILGLMGKTLTELQHPGHLRFFSKRSMERLFHDTGYVDVSVSGRHIYLILPEIKLFDSLLTGLKFQKEYRFTTGSHFYHLSRFAQNCSSFWADSLLARGRKPQV